MRYPFVVLSALMALLAVFGHVHAEERETAIPDPCSGPSALFAILDRPTVSDSACAVPLGHFVLEMGFQRARLRNSDSSTADNYPQAAVRIGLPDRNEFVLLPSNYNRQRIRGISGVPDQELDGYSAVTLGVKHELGYTRSWLGASEVLLTLPTGGSVFGSRGLGVAINGIVSYTLSEQVEISIQLGLSSQTAPKISGGERFTSLISNLVATWQPVPRLQIYGEIYGQSKTGPGQGIGYNFDGGIQCLVTPSWEIDLEGGVRLIGDLGGFNRYFGAGMGFSF